MHHATHLIIRLAIIPLAAILTTAFAATWPGRAHPLSRRSAVGWLLFGACVGMVFLLSDGLYAPQS
ncbi:hypothetical protein [Alicyclobacillus sp.]|uniref:hypothetical protein n=1 Tax=Alicyclobacillus sp. TaxID=61169 RepID=UPI0025C56EF9|nr:hypothetical protein [Alicyclobacillus sp.]MCL6517174.1 hypothetical protein [Alicyclobacillus sp.]